MPLGLATNELFIPMIETRNQDSNERSHFMPSTLGKSISKYEIYIRSFLKHTKSPIMIADHDDKTSLADLVQSIARHYVGGFPETWRFKIGKHRKRQHL